MRHCESELSCPRTQHNIPGQGSNPDRSIRSSLTMSLVFVKRISDIGECLFWTLDRSRFRRHHIKENRHASASTAILAMPTSNQYYEINDHRSSNAWSFVYSLANSQYLIRHLVYTTPVHLTNSFGFWLAFVSLPKFSMTFFQKYKAILHNKLSDMVYLFTMWCPHVLVLAFWILLEVSWRFVEREFLDMEIHLDKIERFIYYALTQERNLFYSESVHWCLYATTYCSVQLTKTFQSQIALSKFKAEEFRNITRMVSYSRNTVFQSF